MLKLNHNHAYSFRRAATYYDFCNALEQAIQERSPAFVRLQQVAPVLVGLAVGRICIGCMLSPLLVLLLLLLILLRFCSHDMELRLPAERLKANMCVGFY